eukprot:12896061-Alexandrium_andersonii.AAC.1
MARGTTHSSPPRLGAGLLLRAVPQAMGGLLTECSRVQLRQAPSLHLRVGISGIAQERRQPQHRR